jgi:outer membrane protein
MASIKPSPDAPACTIGRRFAAALSALFVSGLAVAQTAKVAYVDMQRLLDAAPQMQAGRDALTREFAERDAALKVQEARLAELEATFKRDAAILPKQVADARELELRNLKGAIERTRAKMREDLNARAAEELRKRWDEMHDVVIEYARARGLDMVLESPVIYASAAVDITDEVLDELRRQQAAETPR